MDSEIHNLYAEMLRVFQDNIIIVILYLLGCISLAYHLMHGFQSAFRTLGVHNKRYIALLRSNWLCFFDYRICCFCHDAGKHLYALGVVGVVL